MDLLLVAEANERRLLHGLVGLLNRSLGEDVDG